MTTQYVYVTNTERGKGGTFELLDVTDADELLIQTIWGPVAVPPEGFRQATLPEAVRAEACRETVKKVAAKNLASGGKP